MRIYLVMRKKGTCVMHWTSEDDANLKKFAEAGYTSTQAGDAMGRTRNSILGRAHRLHISFKFIKEKAPVAAPEPEPVVVKEVKKPRKHPPRGSLYESLLRLRHDQCRWPFETTFCDDDKLPGASYCAEHFKLSYRPSRYNQ